MAAFDVGTRFFFFFLVIISVVEVGAPFFFFFFEPVPLVRIVCGALANIKMIKGYFKGFIQKIPKNSPGNLSCDNLHFTPTTSHLRILSLFEGGLQGRFLPNGLYHLLHGRKPAQVNVADEILFKKAKSTPASSVDISKAFYFIYIYDFVVYILIHDELHLA